MNEEKQINKNGLKETPYIYDYNVSVIKIILGFILGISAFGLLLYLTRVFLWGRIIAGLVAWLISLNAPTLIGVISILPVGGLVIWLGILIPAFVIVKAVNIILVLINKNIGENIKRSYIGIGIFHIAFSVIGLIWWTLIALSNPLDFYIIVSYICVFMEMYLGYYIYKQSKIIQPLN